MHGCLSIEKITLVDLGCGSGTFLELCNHKNVNCIGVDISEAMIQIAKKKVPNANLVISDIFKYSIPNCNMVSIIGEIISFASVSKKLKDIEVLFKNIHEIISQDGLLLFDFLILNYDFSKVTIVNEEDYTIINKVTDSGEIVTREITSFLKKQELYQKSVEIHKLRKFDPSILSSILMEIGFKVKILESETDWKILPGRSVFLCFKE
jgi:SAM-dependent methyltransferase